MPWPEPWIEEREFNLRLELRCAFPDDYQGELDGYAWAAEAPAIVAEIVHAAVQAVSRRPGWRVRPANRGVSTDREVTLVLEREPDDG